MDLELESGSIRFDQGLPMSLFHCHFINQNFILPSSWVPLSQVEDTLPTGTSRIK